MSSTPALTVPAPPNKSPLAPRAIAYAKAHASWPQDTCLVFVRSCLGLAPKYGTAMAEWLAAPVAHRHTWYVPPVGVPVHFATSNSAGHVALSAGGGLIYTTDYPHAGQVSLVHITTLESAWGAKYLGWLDTCEGVTVYHG